MRKIECFRNGFCDIATIGRSSGTAVSTNVETMVPLSAIATFTTARGAVSVNHQSGRVAATISFNLPEGVALGTAAAEIQRTMSNMDVPLTITGSFAGTAAAFQSSLSTEPLLILAALAAVYAPRGVNLVEAAGGWQFRTAPDLAASLRKIVEIPRRLPRVAMETLAIVAYHQPVTRTEIEEIRGAALSQTTLDLLLENGFVTPKGRRETPGRPTLWGTTPAFLAHFGLNDLRDLPRREELLIDPTGPIKTAEPEA